MTSMLDDRNVAPATLVDTDASTTPTPERESTFSRDSTKVDLQACKLLPKSTLSLRELSADTLEVQEPSLPHSKEKDLSSTPSINDDGAKRTPPLSSTRRWSLLAIFSLAMFIDIWCYSAFFIFTRTIAHDLDIAFETESWVITSYAVTFASFLLFWGRVSDLYSAKPVFTWGFMLLGIVNLVISFLPDKYSFFILRAIAGIAGSALIPASYRLIVHLFPQDQLGKAFTLFGMSGAISNVTGTVVAGLIEFIPNDGPVQMQSWRWFFRLLAVMILPMGLASMWLIPALEGDNSELAPREKIKRLDVPGSAFMLAAIVLLTLGLTLGASYGFRTAKFLVPFLLSWALFPAFFVWEARVPQQYALLPTRTWRIPNFALLIAFALQIYAWWGVNFLALTDTFTRVRGERPIIAALRLLPQGVVALTVTLILTKWPRFVRRPRWPIISGMVLGIVGYVLMTRPNRFDNAEYWRYLFPGFIVGSGGMMVVFTATNVGIMTSAPPDMAGVAGAVLQVAFQVGSTVGLSIQAGLLTVNEWPENVKVSFYFQMGWAALWLVLFAVFYRPRKNTSGDEENIAVAAH